MATDIEKIEDLRGLQIKHKVRIWKPYMEKYNCQVVGELGVFTGGNFRRMIEHRPQVAVAVDAWKADAVISRNDSGLTQEEKDCQYTDFVVDMQHKPFVKVCRGYTFEMVLQFPDNYFDLLYIDADHTYEGCSKDLRDWWPKMKSGGAFTGDDYRHGRARPTGVRFGVIEAVTEFSQKNGVSAFELPRHGWAIIKP